MDLQLKGKTALVTGSTAGIGLAIAQKLLEEGATVYVNGRTQARVDAALSRLRQEVPGAAARGVAADFSKVQEVNALLKEIPEVDILVNNVGMFTIKDFTDISDADWLGIYEVNVLSGIRLSRHYFPGMLKNNWGRIIFISSESALHIPAEMIHYGVTKTAQLAVSRGLAELTKGTAVTVNAVLPGPTRSEGLEGFVEEMSAQQNKPQAEVEKEFFELARPTSLLQRFTTTEEIANLVAFVASPLSSGTNGAALRVDGGVVKTIA
ncbi:SDR family oxidoreductase [Compostibacter hankyongensis]|uniref:SDR family oxidoreductase n=1 Tax=Compostibacter hankyongensis TaxID=1007089 RepID=A0ABP8G0Q6_9BACT